jgi:hypothetical protein
MEVIQKVLRFSKHQGLELRIPLPMEKTAIAKQDEKPVSIFAVYLFDTSDSLGFYYNFSGVRVEP